MDTIMSWDKLRGTCDVLAEAACLYKADNIIDFGRVVFENGLDCSGVAIKSGIEILSAYLQEPLEIKIEDNKDFYVITKQFYYEKACYYQIEYINKSIIKDGVIYDNTSNRVDNSE